MRRSLPLIYALIFIYSGCTLIDPDEQEPAYLVIPQFQFNTVPGEGSDSEAITEVWIYADDQPLGVFDLPARIPVLRNGPVALRIFPGIKNNGIATTRIKYPFYTSFDTTLNMMSMTDHVINPQFTYFDNLDFHHIEFENNANPFFPEPSSDLDLTITEVESQVFEGNGSAFVQLQGNNDQLLVRTDEHFEWQPGENVFAEMNYSNNNSFAVGVIAYNSATSARSFALIFNPGEASVGLPQWKKIYVDLGYVVSQHPDADYFEFYIECNKQSDVAIAELYFDNLKFVRFDN